MQTYVSEDSDEVEEYSLWNQWKHIYAARINFGDKFKMIGTFIFLFLYYYIIAESLFIHY